MGGKGRKRREKNYKAAHGGATALPPPPKSSQLDALPFKLRQIISFSKNQNDSNGLSKKLDSGEAQKVDAKVDTSATLKAPQHCDEEVNAIDDIDDKSKKKRKRKEVKDLRFAMDEDKTRAQLKKKERKKKYEAKKKKHKKVEEDELLGFPGKEKIKFGDIVQAPPKLSFIPKGVKVSQDASHERLRLRAIEDYRSRKAWTSRPGNHCPPPVTTPEP
ncbi:uncharacterized protein LOC131612065 [Vicia villosa]|uniref:uncharacterized protein LOC131612065 n=1 Tax=Vicia villosa TaxID=3911 RepID=UPI00273AD908|nr:uncharacterized protein LOC131612065 [Vicia villosa]